jgi:cysteine desulfurase/selenocysteine lyase
LVISRAELPLTGRLETMQPVAEIGVLCRQRRVPLAVDVTQSAGLISIDKARAQVSAGVFIGPKSLLGPTGIGGLVMGRGLDVCATRFGNIRVESSSLIHSPDTPTA